jgi:3',5'-cyclic AMP phosphodiesterase CpdA
MGRIALHLGGLDRTGQTTAARSPGGDDRQRLHNRNFGRHGTGLYGAPACQQSIQNGADRYSLLLHLGDVYYYSATPDEVEQRFFRFWPNKAPINRTMNGNHEMVTGGHSYFETMLPRIDQKASYFAMQNDNWLLVVLDTEYFESFGGQEGNLDNAQIAWLRPIVQAADRRKVALFSHHQPLTQLDDNNGGNLLSQLATYQLADKILLGIGVTSTAA